jgi:DNA polymerase (family 10)
MVGIEKRVVFKKGKFIVTRKGNFVLKLAEKLFNQLKPFCKKIVIVGSIRRKEKNPVDIDFVLIPRDKNKLESFLKTKGKFLQGGEHESTWKIESVKVELYYTIEEEWGAALLAYSSKVGAGIGLRMIAKRKGLKLNNHGLFDKKGRKIAGKTEREIYDALGRKFKLPENR